jgi:hypothetical protein
MVSIRHHLKSSFGYIQARKGWSVPLVSGVSVGEKPDVRLTLSRKEIGKWQFVLIAEQR